MMRRTKTTLLTGSVALALAFVAGCGDDDDEESASTGTTTTEATVPETTGKPAGAVDVSLTEYKVTLTKGDVSKPGVYTLNVSNDGTITHALEAEGPNGETETEDLAPGDSAELKVDFTDGDYELYCPIGDHEDRGMKTNVTVSG